MRIRFNPRWLLVSILLFSLQFCRAQVVVVPSTLNFNLGSTNNPESQLWDLNGSYAVDMVVENKGHAEPVQVAFTLVHGPSGKLSTITSDLVNASVTFNNDNNSSFVCQATVSGKVTGVNGVARAHFTVRFIGNGSLGNRSTTIKGSLTVDAETDQTTGKLLGARASKFSASFAGLNAIKGIADFATPLPPNIDGSWKLKMNLVGLSKLTGTGVILTPHQALGVNLTGKFQRDLLVTKAVGANTVPDTVSGKGLSATISIPTSFDEVLFRGKVLGQSMNFDVSVPPPPAEE
jgi:hypothetical protein